MVQEAKDIPIEWDFPEDLQTLYANNFLVQHSESEFIVSFFEVFPPLLLGEPEEIQKQVEQLSSIRSRCVARIVIPTQKMESFIGALVQNHTRFMSKYSPEENESDESQE
ncbi:MAG: DUF3467 domain-containing protein [Caldilineaceae bacterium]|nr:DUF3467 domain-containing protein [Caldilineaceae bacterium]